MCIIAYSILYWFIFQRRLCILLHMSEKIVYFASYFRQYCIFCFILQTRLCILLHISDKIISICFIFLTRLCILLHISDKIVYFASYFRQYCIFGVCPVNFNCDAGYTYCHWCIFDLNEK